MIDRKQLEKTFDDLISDAAQSDRSGIARAAVVAAMKELALVMADLTDVTQQLRETAVNEIELRK